MFYADDLIIFYSTDKKGFSNLLEIMDKYGEFSGQVVNKNKSSVFFSKSITSKHAISKLMGIKQGSLPFMYLGLPFSQDPRRVSISKR